MRAYVKNGVTWSGLQASTRAPVERLHKRIDGGELTGLISPVAHDRSAAAGYPEWSVALARRPKRQRQLNG
jgi:hypothetical protein